MCSYTIGARPGVGFRGILDLEDPDDQLDAAVPPVARLAGEEGGAAQPALRDEPRGIPVARVERRLLGILPRPHRLPPHPCHLASPLSR